MGAERGSHRNGRSTVPESGGLLPPAAASSATTGALRVRRFLWLLAIAAVSIITVYSLLGMYAHHAHLSGGFTGHSGEATGSGPRWVLARRLVSGWNDSDPLHEVISTEITKLMPSAWKRMSTSSSGGAKKPVSWKHMPPPAPLSEEERERLVQQWTLSNHMRSTCFTTPAGSKLSQPTFGWSILKSAKPGARGLNAVRIRSSRPFSRTKRVHMRSDQAASKALGFDATRHRAQQLLQLRATEGANGKLRAGRSQARPDTPMQRIARPQRKQQDAAVADVQAPPPPSPNREPNPALQPQVPSSSHMSAAEESKREKLLRRRNKQQRKSGKPRDLQKARKASVSVVVALRDRDVVFRSALASWITHKELREIIIVDWASKIPVSFLLENWGIDDPRIKILRVEDEPFFALSRAYNLGLRVALSDLVLKLDSDTFLSQDFFESHPLDANTPFMYRGYWNDTRGIETDVSPLQVAVNHLNGVFYAPRSVLAMIDGYDERMCHYGYEDESFYNRLQYLGVEMQRFLQGIHHIAHTRGNKTVLDERSSLFLNLYSEESFGAWFPSTAGNRSRYSFLNFGDECVATVEHAPSCFDDMYTPESRQEESRKWRALSFLVACKHCTHMKQTLDKPAHVLESLMHLYEGPATGYRFSVAIYGDFTGEESRTLCGAVKFARANNLNLAIVLDHSHSKLSSAKSVVSTTEWGTKLVVVAGYYPEFLSSKFFVAANEPNAVGDLRHIVFERGVVLPGTATPARQPNTQEVLAEAEAIRQCHAIYRHVIGPYKRRPERPHP